VSARNRFVVYALERMGDVVLWGELDCSELVARAFKDAGGPDWTKTHTAQRLHDEASRALVDGERPLPGDLVLHGYKATNDALKVTHVGIWLAGGQVISADGATPKIKTLAEAKAKPSCRVRLHSSINYRPDLPYLAVRRFTALDDLDHVSR
jgi:cell wall-associated NlpC family hydrolase